VDVNLGGAPAPTGIATATRPLRLGSTPARSTPDAQWSRPSTLTARPRPTGLRATPVGASKVAPGHPRLSRPDRGLRRTSAKARFEQGGRASGHQPPAATQSPTCTVSGRDEARKPRERGSGRRGGSVSHRCVRIVLTCPSNESASRLETRRAADRRYGAVGGSAPGLLASPGAGLSAPEGPPAAEAPGSEAVAPGRRVSWTLASWEPAGACVD
jgi:hypothetical protein